MKIVDQHGFPSVGFPLIGAGSGGFSQERGKAIIVQALEACDSPVLAKVVVYQRTR